VSRRPNPLPWQYCWRTNLIQIPIWLWLQSCAAPCRCWCPFSTSPAACSSDSRASGPSGLVWGSGSSLTVRGAENLGKCPVAVYASNHTSYMDTPVMFASLPFQFRILAKKELWPIAFIGWYLDRSGQIPIDTVNPAPRFPVLASE
jgi:1-acyl-sn-glycerol-3-phosphate acyltransferase